MISPSALFACSESMFDLADASVTADRAPDKLPTTTDLEPVAVLVPGPVPETGAILAAGHAPRAVSPIVQDGMEVDVRA